MRRSRGLQEPQIEGQEHQHDADVDDQARPEVVAEEQHVHADHDNDQCEHVEPDDERPSHLFFLRGTPTLVHMLRRPAREDAGCPAKASLSSAVQMSTAEPATIKLSSFSREIKDGLRSPSVTCVRVRPHLVLCMGPSARRGRPATERARKEAI